jgi:hypothetical protein
MTFSPIDAFEPLDVEEHIRLAPEGWKVRGFFLQYLVETATKRGFDAWRIPKTPPTDGDIELRDSLRGDAAFARLFEPNKPIRAALRKIGWYRLPALRSSPPSKILLQLTPLTPTLLLKALPEASKLSGSTSTIKVGDCDEGRCLYVVERYHGFRDVLVGAIDAALEVGRAVGTVRIRARSELDFDLLVEWEVATAREA